MNIQSLEENNPKTAEDWVVPLIQQPWDCGSGQGTLRETWKFYTQEAQGDRSSYLLITSRIKFKNRFGSSRHAPAGLCAHIWPSSLGTSMPVPCLLPNHSAQCFSSNLWTFPTPTVCSHYSPGHKSLLSFSLPFQILLSLLLSGITEPLRWIRSCVWTLLSTPPDLQGVSFSRAQST